MLRSLPSFTGRARSSLDGPGDVFLRCRQSTHKHTIFITGARVGWYVTQTELNLRVRNRGASKPFPCGVTNIYRDQLLRICDDFTSESNKWCMCCVVDHLRGPEDEGYRGRTTEVENTGKTVYAANASSVLFSAYNSSEARELLPGSTARPL